MDNLLITNIILSLCLLISLALGYSFYNKITVLEEKLSDANKKVESANSEKNKAKKDRDNFISIKEGDKILYDSSLTHTDPTTNKVTSFSLLYEMEVIEVAKDKLKVKALNFTSNDSFARDANNKSGLISYMSNKWIDKKDAQPVINTTKANRSSKLEKLLEKKP